MGKGEDTKKKYEISNLTPLSRARKYVKRKKSFIDFLLLILAVFRFYIMIKPNSVT